ncbi:hypothetical protein VOWphi5012_050 [Vibrio phage phi50-12]|uniref:UvrD-like helicase C-terminal domain-containing protein n=1 Tax=Vibrio phage phi50-12 TaxID=2654972 RepID=A0A5P8PRA4_9CAUD|nr:hypothetical protein KNU82_gp050 [Vibrio phage phi50-12]QFR59834.1 hypothetical protein VOWphi5012_050 [Vibrio phage phi50-12]
MSPLTPEQQGVHDKIRNFAIKKNPEDIIIDGPGGVGKGHLLKYIHFGWSTFIDACRIFDNNFYISSLLTGTTNEACKVLGVQGTIYSHSRLRPCFRTNKMQPRGAPKLNSQLVFVDESSFVNQDQHEMIKAQLPNSRICWVMDSAQLAPVNEEFPYLTTLGLKTYPMTTIMRSQGKLQDFNTYLRKCVLDGVNPMVQEWHNGDSIICVDGKGFQKHLEQHYTTDWSPSTARILSFHRERTRAYNEYIHTQVYKHTELYPRGTILRQSGYSQAMRDGALLTVNSSSITKDSFGECYVFNKSQFMPVNPKEYIRNFKAEYGSKPEGLVNLQHTYANTIHVAQGSTIETVFLDLIDVEDAYRIQREMYRRLVYSGASRASKRLIIRVSQ